jgi:MinD superfamily P-loop ATPase
MSDLLRLLPRTIKISFADVDIETSDDTNLLKKTLVNTIQETIRLQYPATQQIET